MAEHRVGRPLAGRVVRRQGSVRVLEAIDVRGKGQQVVELPAESPDRGRHLGRVERSAVPREGRVDLVAVGQHRRRRLARDVDAPEHPQAEVVAVPLEPFAGPGRRGEDRAERPLRRGRGREHARDVDEPRAETAAIVTRFEPDAEAGSRSGVSRERIHDDESTRGRPRGRSSRGTAMAGQ